MARKRGHTEEPYDTVFENALSFSKPTLEGAMKQKGIPYRFKDNPNSPGGFDVQVPRRHVKRAAPFVDEVLNVW